MASRRRLAIAAVRSARSSARSKHAVWQRLRFGTFALSLGVFGLDLLGRGPQLCPAPLERLIDSRRLRSCGPPDRRLRVRTPHHPGLHRRELGWLAALVDNPEPDMAQCTGQPAAAQQLRRAGIDQRGVQRLSKPIRNGLTDGPASILCVSPGRPHQLPGGDRALPDVGCCLETRMPGNLDHEGTGGSAR